MANRKVRAGSSYRFDPVLFDVCNPPAGKTVARGDVLTVVNLPGCPRANTMGMCHVNDARGDFAGMVCTNSLVPEKEWVQRLAEEVAA